MKVSVNWLKELVDIDLSVDELAHTLTMAGLEVEEITPVATFEGIVVAEVKTVAPHPNADKLRVCEVDAGTGILLQIVCGAPNVFAGMRVPCALVGAKLPGLEIKAAKLRGVDSSGMLCSARELGLSEDHGGLLAFPADAPIGMDVRQYLDMGDHYLTLKITPNRGDCLSMIGIARDVAAVTGKALRLPAIESFAPTSNDARPITISAPAACGRYAGRVITGIDANAPTPDWMKQRLERAGFRSISALVDITNYLTLERGRPMHAFDNDKLTGGIEVRFARPGEEIKLLNEQQVALTPDMLLIADECAPVAIAGVMGGYDTMCTDETKSVFFEAAYFDPAIIRGKARRLGINSDAAFRFERGVDPNSAAAGIEYATGLTLAICGTPATRVGPLNVEEGTAAMPVTTAVRPAHVNRLIGLNITTTEMQVILTRLECCVEMRNGTLFVTPPAYRFDLAIEVDYVEEIARIHGYEKIPFDAPVSTLPMMAIPESGRSRYAIRHQLAHLGYQEVINYSFTPDRWEADFAGNVRPIRLSNPIASQMSVMRTNLIGGLIASVRHNLNHGESRLKLFEIGRCFLGDAADIAVQPERLGGIAYGARLPEQWNAIGADSSPVDFFAVKGDLELLLATRDIRFEKLTHPALHPGRAAQIWIDGEVAGLLGELHPRWQQEYELPLAPIVFDLALDVVSRGSSPGFVPFSRMQAVRRDIAILVNESVQIGDLESAIKRRKMEAIVDFSVFDIYRGENLGSGKKSVAFRIVMQDTDRTLVDSEVDSKVAEILKALSEEFGATLRK